MKPILLALFLVLSSHVSGAAEMAVSFDDLPYVMPSKTPPEVGLAQVQQVIQVLEKHHIVATGFVIGSQVSEKSAPALNAFVDAGHTIGNHSWSHTDYGTQTVDAFRKEVHRTDQVLEQFFDAPRFYRFPFLREGRTSENKMAASNVLRELGYQNVPVTIDNDDWRYNAELMQAEGDAEATAEILARYLAHMQKQTHHYQGLAQTEFGRDVKHILLLHLNSINAEFLDVLLSWYATQGWRFITVAEALTDPIYAMPDLYTGERGLSQIERVSERLNTAP